MKKLILYTSLVLFSFSFAEAKVKTKSTKSKATSSAQRKLASHKSSKSKVSKKSKKGKKSKRHTASLEPEIEVGPRKPIDIKLGEHMLDCGSLINTPAIANDDTPENRKALREKTYCWIAQNRVATYP